MATDPTALLQGLLGTTGLSGAIMQNAQNNALEQQGVRQQLQQGQLQIGAMQQAQQRDAAFQNIVASHPGNWSPQEIYDLSLRFPEQAKRLSDAQKGKDEAQRNSDLGFFGGVYAAAKSGKSGLVLKQLQQRRDAEARAGIDTSELDSAISGIQSGQANALTDIQDTALSHIYQNDPSGFAEAFGIKTAGQNHFSTAGDGVIYDQRTGQVVREAQAKPEYQYDSTNNRWLLKPGTEGGGQVSGGGGASSGQPRSVRNNNPGNVRYGAFAKAQGATGSDSAGYAIFPSQSVGQSAQASLLAGKGYFGGGRRTVASIIEKWAPPASKGGDNTNAQTANYINYVARKLNVNPQDALTPAVLPRMAQAMAEFESGNKGGAVRQTSDSTSRGGPPAVIDVPTGNGASGGDGAYVPGTNVGGVAAGAIDAAAQRYNLTGKIPPGLGRKGDVQKAIISRASQLANGQDAGDLLADQAGRAADTKALDQLQKTSASILAFENTALRNGALALRTAAKVDNSGIPVFNAWINAGRRSTGSGPVASFNAAISTFANEYARVTSGSNGVTSDTARAHAHELINSAQSPEQLIDVMKTLSTDMHNRRVGLEHERSEILGRIHGTRQQPAAQGQPTHISGSGQYGYFPGKGWVKIK